MYSQTLIFSLYGWRVFNSMVFCSHFMSLFHVIFLPSNLTMGNRWWQSWVQALMCHYCSNAALTASESLSQADVYLLGSLFQRSWFQISWCEQCVWYVSLGSVSGSMTAQFCCCWNIILDSGFTILLFFLGYGFKIRTAEKLAGVSKSLWV